MPHIYLKPPNTITINNVPVEYIHLSGKWIAQWTGSDGQKCRCVRTSKQAMITAVQQTMEVRIKTFGAQY